MITKYVIYQDGEPFGSFTYDTLDEAMDAADSGDQIMEYEYEFTDSSLVAVVE